MRYRFKRNFLCGVHLKKQKGFTLIEMVTAMLVMTLVLITTVALTVATLHTYAMGSNKTYAYVDANRALEWVAKDIRRCIMANIDISGKKLTLTMPMIDTTTGFAKQPLQSDGYPIIYYLGDANGNFSTSGTYLWRETTNVGRRSMIIEVAGAKFERTANPFGTNMNLVKVTLTAQRGTGIGQQSRTLTTSASVRN